MSECWKLSGRLSSHPSPLTAAHYVPAIWEQGDKTVPAECKSIQNSSRYGRQNAGEDSGSQTTQGEEEGKFSDTAVGKEWERKFY